MTFKLDKTLEKDSKFITDLELCQIRLINNSDFPWVILVPRLSNIIEITDLNDTEYNLLNAETKLVAQALQSESAPDKLNIATLGNVVSQLHIHIIARYKNDKLFPKPVWGCEFTHYSENAIKEKISGLKNAIGKASSLCVKL